MIRKCAKCGGNVGDTYWQDADGSVRHLWCPPAIEHGCLACGAPCRGNYCDDCIAAEKEDR